jgi:adenylosuccinate lyase
MSLDERAAAANMARYGPFAATERVLIALVAAGANRQEAHEWLRQASLRAWEQLRQGAEANPLVALVVSDLRIRHYLSAERVQDLMDAGAYVGTAPQRARALAQTIASILG